MQIEFLFRSLAWLRATVVPHNEACCSFAFIRQRFKTLNAIALLARRRFKLGTATRARGERGTHDLVSATAHPLHTHTHTCLRRVRVCARTVCRLCPQQMLLLFLLLLVLGYVNRQVIAFTEHVC